MLVQNYLRCQASKSCFCSYTLSLSWLCHQGHSLFNIRACLADHWCCTARCCHLLSSLCVTQWLWDERSVLWIQQRLRLRHNIYGKFLSSGVATGGLPPPLPPWALPGIGKRSIFSSGGYNGKISFDGKFQILKFFPPPRQFSNCATMFVSIIIYMGVRSGGGEEVQPPPRYLGKFGQDSSFFRHFFHECVLETSLFKIRHYLP